MGVPRQLLERLNKVQSKPDPIREMEYGDKPVIDVSAAAPPSAQEQLRNDIEKSRAAELNVSSSVDKPADEAYLSQDRTQTAIGSANAYANKVERSYADYTKAMEKGISELETTQQESQKSFADRILESRREYEQRQSELDADVQNDIRSARWTGAAELAASIVNLAVVGNGASNQVYNNYSVDWMKQVDRDKEMSRKYRDQMRDKLRGLKDQLEQMKASDSQTILSLRNGAARTAMQGRLAVEQARQRANEVSYRNKRQDERDARQDAQWQKNFEETVRQRKAQEGLSREQMAMTAATYGLTKNGKGEWEYSVSSPRRGGSGSGSGGSDKNVEISLPPIEGRGKGEVMSVNPESLAATLYASKDILTLTPEEKQQMRQIEMSLRGKESDKVGAALTSLLSTNSQARELVRSIADYTRETELTSWGTPQETPAPAPSKREMLRQERAERKNRKKEIHTPEQTIFPTDTMSIGGAGDLDKLLGL